jgi:hypothetical protein
VHFAEKFYKVGGATGKRMGTTAVMIMTVLGASTTVALAVGIPGMVSETKNGSSSPTVTTYIGLSCRFTVVAIATYW